SGRRTTVGQSNLRGRGPVNPRPARRSSEIHPSWRRTDLRRTGGGGGGRGSTVGLYSDAGVQREGGGYQRHVLHAWGAPGPRRPLLEEEHGSLLVQDLLHLLEVGDALLRVERLPLVDDERVELGVTEPRRRPGGVAHVDARERRLGIVERAGIEGSLEVALRN